MLVGAGDRDDFGHLSRRRCNLRQQGETATLLPAVAEIALWMISLPSWTATGPYLAEPGLHSSFSISTWIETIFPSIGTAAGQGRVDADLAEGAQS